MNETKAIIDPFLPTWFYTLPTRPMSPVPWLVLGHELRSQIAEASTRVRRRPAPRVAPEHNVEPVECYTLSPLGLYRHKSINRALHWIDCNTSRDTLNKIRSGVFHRFRTGQYLWFEGSTIPPEAVDLIPMEEPNND